MERTFVMMIRLMVVLAAALLFGSFATSLAPPAETVQTVEAKKNNKDKKDKKDKRKDRKNKRDRKKDRNAPFVSSYVNPDIGLATENTNANPDSDCDSPDQNDTQQLSDPGQTNRNVHNDACILKNGNPVDTAVSFEISGVGEFSACPDPDGAGPKTSTNSGSRCYLTGYQETGNPGDLEYHSRVNNDDTPGQSTVTFCVDANNNGCGDAKTKDRTDMATACLHHWTRGHPGWSRMAGEWSTRPLPSLSTARNARSRQTDSNRTSHTP
jgi:hypothetical protein